ncbi:restriction endonuclease subunit S [Shimia sp. SDUM112013]|uniref:restriction endonuclease subunit S n=1 Tax=Shimia sp. SDUM112013 TaxID=3136160 RepID=UPI0032EFE690
MSGAIIDFFPQTNHLKGNYVRLGLVSRIFSGGTPDKGNLDYWEGGDIPWIGSGEVNQGIVQNPTAHITRQAVERSATKLFPKDSLIMALAGQGKTKGTVARMGIDAYGNQSLGCISDYSGESRFLYWWLTSLYREIRNLSSQETRDGLNQSMLGQIPVPLFDLATQRQIADFLDRETARIDLLIEKKQRLVALLAERQVEALEAAVLGGANVQRGNGGEWLSDLAQGWRFIPLKHFVSSKGGATPSKDRDDFWVGEIPWVSPKDMKVDVIEDVPDHVSEAAVKGSALSLIPEGAVLIVVRGMILARYVPVCRLGCEGTINQDMKALISDNRVASSEYLQLMLQGFSSVLMTFVEEAAHGTKKLRSDQLFNMKFPVPPLDVQAGIIRNYLAMRDHNKSLQEKTNSSIDHLKEYRSALITAAVTGQIDVTTYAKSGTPDRHLDAIQEEMGA